MQFRGLDARLTVLTERTAQTARFDRTENVRLEDARSGRSIREGQRRDLAHVFHTVAEPMIRNVAPAMVTEVFTPAQGAGWQGLRKQQRQRELDNCKKMWCAPGARQRRRRWTGAERVAHCDGDFRRLTPELGDPITTEPLS